MNPQSSIGSEHSDSSYSNPEPPFSEVSPFYPVISLIQLRDLGYEAALDSEDALPLNHELAVYPVTCTETGMRASFSLLLYLETESGIIIPLPLKVLIDTPKSLPMLLFECTQTMSKPESPPA